MNQYKNNFYGNALMTVTKKLASALIPKNTNITNITLQTLGMDSTNKTTPIIILHSYFLSHAIGLLTGDFNAIEYFMLIYL